MSALAIRALSSYSSLEVETGIAGASPERLIVMLYEGALKAVFVAKAAITRGDTPGKGGAISKAISIIDDGLRAVLDMEKGGDIALNLRALYEYMSNRLLYANLKNDQASLDEVARLLSELKQAWEALERTSRPVPQPPADAGEQRGPMSFGKV